MLFPFSSTGSPNYPVSSSMTNSSHVFHNFQADSSGGFLGLKTETQHPVPRTSPEINKDLNSQSASCAIGSETEPQAAKKKGEKKIRKPKYAFQTRSQVDILDDGYRWRKYGQKAVKNNRFPRYLYVLISLAISNFCLIITFAFSSHFFVKTMIMQLNSH